MTSYAARLGDNRQSSLWSQTLHTYPMSPPSDTTHVSDSEPEREASKSPPKTRTPLAVVSNYQASTFKLERRIAAIERELGGLKRRMRDVGA
jgi:hypothetical protein